MEATEPRQDGPSADVLEPRRRGRERDAEAARAAILSAAEEVFAQRGFSGARVDEIAEASGYNKALIFHYFGDKLGLYQTLVGRMKEQNFAFYMKNLARFAGSADAQLEAADVRGFLAASVRWNFDEFVARPRLMRILAWEAAEGWQTFVSCHPQSTTYSGWPKEGRRLIQRAQEAGIFRAEMSPEMIVAMVATLPLFYIASLRRFTTMFPAADFTSPEALARAREQIVALVLHGVLAHDHHHDHDHNHDHNHDHEWGIEETQHADGV
jgi:TetR/AcrR family transcriptional regulator